MQNAPPPSPEAVLTDVLARGLRSGDLVGNPPVEPLADLPPDPAQADLNAALAKQVDLDARIRSALAGGAPDGLCARLGYRHGGDPVPIIGGDVTRGLCAGMTAADLAPRIAATAPVAETLPAAMGSDHPAPPDRVSRAPSRHAATVPDKPSSVVAIRPAPRQVRNPSPVEMIPAHARYVQIGIYQDEGNALAALRRLSQMGYRTAQRQEATNAETHKAILAGPFTDRQALIAALTRLRASGYPKAIAR